MIFCANVSWTVGSIENHAKEEVRPFEEGR